jgi:hypothetical protein
MNVNGIITCTVVCNPFDRRRESVDKLSVEVPDLRRGPVLPINAYNIFVFAAWTKLSQKTFAV